MTLMVVLTFCYMMVNYSFCTNSHTYCAGEVVGATG